MKYGLEDKVIEKINSVLEQNAKVDKAYIFGSRAKGNYRNDSDIDIAIKGYDILLDDILRMQVGFEEKGIKQKVDLVDYDAIKEPALKDHIDRVGIEFYSKWKKTLLGSLISIKGGFSYKGKYIGSGDSYLLGMGCVSFTDKFLQSGARPYSGDAPEPYLVKPGDLVLATRQQSDNLPILGLPAIIPEDYISKKVIAGTNLYMVKNDSEVDNKFLYWLLKSPNYKSHISASSKGTTVRMITKDAVESFEFACPPKSERDRISETLWSIENKIDLLHKQNETMEEMSKILFRQWFVEDIEDKNLVELESVVMFDPKEKVDKNFDYQFFDMKCLSNSDMSIANGERRKASSATSFRNDDTLLAKITPCLENGKTGFVMHLDNGEIARGSTEFIVMRSKGAVSPYWIYCLARNNDFRDRAIQSMTGTSGRQRVQTGTLKKYIVNADDDKMKYFDAAVGPLFEKVRKNQKQIDNLTQMRETLLPKLMTGEVRVKM